MARVPFATLAGIPLEALETVGWRLTQGVEPYQRAFEMHRSRAEAILKRAPPGQPVELVIGGTRTLVVEGLYVLHVTAAKHPDRISIMVADSRYWADRRIVYRHYNQRRKSGEFRLVDGNMERIAPLPDVTFAKFSLRNELVAWIAEKVIEDVMDEVAGAKGWSLGKVDFGKLKQLDVDGLELADDGQTAIKKVLDYVPSLSVYMSKKALWTLTFKNGNEEEEQLGNAPPPIVGPDLPIEVDMSRTRPSKIEVYFQPEDEVRFDFLEGVPSTVTIKEPRIFRNVLPLPDRKLTISGKVVVQTTWVEITQALFDAWNNDTANPASATIGGKTIKLPPISFQLIQKLWFSPGGYHFFYEIGGGNSIWARRWNAIMRHYRQTFQVDRRWRDRIRFARANRVAIQDPENARRAPSDMWADHAVIPSVKRVALTRNDASKKLAINYPAWDTNDSSRYLVKGQIAETALLTPVDEDQLVYHVIYQHDQQGNTLAMVPSLLSKKTDGGPVDIPEADPRAARALFMVALAQLSPKHRLSTVLTVTSASPQGLAGLYKVEVTPEQAKKKLPSAVAAKIRESKGPVFQIFVAPGVFVAPFAWRDEDAVFVENSILNGAPRVNRNMLYPEHVRNIAESMGAITYALFADRRQGMHVADMDPEATPVGRISTIAHELGRTGILLTRRDMPPSVKALNFRGLLPDETRRLLGKVQV